jgi:hypothetical protein
MEMSSLCHVSPICPLADSVRHLHQPSRPYRGEASEAVVHGRPYVSGLLILQNCQAGCTPASAGQALCDVAMQRDGTML